MLVIMMLGSPGRLAGTNLYKQSSPFSFSSANRCGQPAQDTGDLEMMEPQDGRGLAGPLSSKELEFSHNELISEFVFSTTVSLP